MLVYYLEKNTTFWYTFMDGIHPGSSSVESLYYKYCEKITNPLMNIKSIMQTLGASHHVTNTYS